MAVPASRSPVVAAILTLVIIWTIYMIQAPSGTRSAAVDRMKGAITSIQAGTLDHTATTKVKEENKVMVEDKKENPKSKGWSSSPTDRPLVLYAYAETPNARTNLQYFIAHGIHAAADFIFILNGETDAHTLVPEKSNIKIIKRVNDCYDLGAYGEVLTKDNLYAKYKRFIMLNASIRGPFLPYWSEQCWSDMFLRKVTDTVKLVGMTVNCWPRPHVQSMIWATDKIGIGHLLFPKVTAENPNRLGINQCFHDWDLAVAGEINATSIIRDAGYKVDVMMTLFHADDDYVGHCDSSVNGDFLWNNGYHGTNIHPYETIFLKTNRGIDPLLVERLTDWHNKANYSSYEKCLA